MALTQYWEALLRGPRTVELDRLAADQLLTAGDVRGEFMALTLKRLDRGGAVSSTERKKLTKLYKRLRLDWLGALAPVVRSTGRFPPVDTWESRHGGPPGPEREDVPFDGYDSNDPNFEIWERGFPVRLTCQLRGSTIGAHEWLTVRELFLAPPQDEGVHPLELGDPVTRHLRVVRTEDAWTPWLREYLRRIGREALLDEPSEWSHSTLMSL